MIRSRRVNLVMKKGTELRELGPLPGSAEHCADLEAAIGLVREEGWQALTARALGKRLGASVAPVYSTFGSMEALERAILQEARRRLEKAMSASCTPQAFLNIGVGMAVFAREEAHLSSDAVSSASSKPGASWPKLRPRAPPAVPMSPPPLCSGPSTRPTSSSSPSRSMSTSCRRRSAPPWSASPTIAASGRPGSPRGSWPSTSADFPRACRTSRPSRSCAGSPRKRASRGPAGTFRARLRPSWPGRSFRAGSTGPWPTGA
jgi:hypothetical protein